MAATVTLASTSLQKDVAIGDTSIIVASSAGILPGMRLFGEGELMTVLSFGPASSLGSVINVRRGVDGTRTFYHDCGNDALYIGTPDQFYSQDPQGSVPIVPLVLPWINVTNGNIWWVIGDELPIGGVDRNWILQQMIPGFSSLGVRNNTQSITGPS